MKCDTIPPIKYCLPYSCHIHNLSRQNLNAHMKAEKTMIIYDGPSLLDGTPIVAIAIRKSGNAKTGDMVQTYILCRDIDPRDANKTGADYSICGACRHRGTPTNDPNRKLAENRSCYVNIAQGVLIVWKSFQRGIYDTATGMTLSPS